MMIATAGAMICGRRSEPGPPSLPGGEGSLPRTAAVGAVIGVVAGLIGAGGGFLVVRALTLLGGLAMAEAIGTSLLPVRFWGPLAAAAAGAAAVVAARRYWRRSPAANRPPLGGGGRVSGGHGG